MTIKTVYTLPSISWRHNRPKWRKINLFLADSWCQMLNTWVRPSETFQTVSFLAECMGVNEPAKNHRKKHPHKAVRNCNGFPDTFTCRCHLSLPALFPVPFFHCSLLHFIHSVPSYFSILFSNHMDAITLCPVSLKISFSSLMIPYLGSWLKTYKHIHTCI